MSIVRRFILPLTAVASAAPVPIHYPNSLLDQRRPHYQEDIGWNLNNAVLSRLTPREKAKLGPLRLEIPLRGGLFGFLSYRDNETGVIVMPAESLRFFSDLCIAAAWLAAKGYSLSTIADYLGMLKYGSASALGLDVMPLPLAALGIPEGGLEEAGVESRRSACFSTGLVFILNHELGHLVYGHQGYENVSPERAQAAEAAADRFSLEVMSRMGDLPLGALYWFFFTSHYQPHRGDFANPDEWHRYVASGTHPLSSARLTALASGLERYANRFAAGEQSVLALAPQIRSIGKTLADEEMQIFQRVHGVNMRPDMLAPRTSDYWEVEPPAKPLEKRPFNGYYVGTIGRDKETVPVKLLLYRRDDRVFGRYSYAGIGGNLRGKVEKGVLQYDYYESGGRGQGRLQITAAGAVQGTWSDSRGRRGTVQVRRQ
jgi:hypothetical protein